MAASPYRIIDRRSGSGYVNNYAANTLVEAATQNTDRKTVPNLDYDVHRNVSSLGRRTMMSLGRWLFSNFPAVRGALREQAELTSSIYEPIWHGRDKAWNSLAAEWVYQHSRICDIAGPPYNMRLYRRNLLIAVKRDGDALTVLTQTVNGYPKLQVIPGHRIGSSNSETVVTGTGLSKEEWIDIGAPRQPYDGATIIDGVIVDDYTCPLGYRFLPGNPWNYAEYTDIPARDCFLSFDPEYVGQLRGWSAMGASLFSWQDVAESRKFELIAQKVGAAIALIENNEAGEADTAAAAISLPASTESTAGTAAGLVTETLDGGLIRYFKANSGAGLEGFKNDRPSQNQREFEAAIVRSNFYGMDWSVDFSLDPTKIGGAPMRVVVDKLNRVIVSNQDIIIEPACRRYIGYAVAKAMKGDWLAWNDDWYLFEFQGPGRLTADRKYDSQVDINEHAAGMGTMAKYAAQRAGDWLDDREQRDVEVEDLLLRAQTKAERYGIPIELALTLLGAPAPLVSAIGKTDAVDAAETAAEQTASGQTSKDDE